MNKYPKKTHSQKNASLIVYWHNYVVNINTMPYSNCSYKTGQIQNITPQLKRYTEGITL